VVVCDPSFEAIWYFMFIFLQFYALVDGGAFVVTRALYFSVDAISSIWLSRFSGHEDSES